MTEREQHWDTRSSRMVDSPEWVESAIRLTRNAAAAQRDTHVSQANELAAVSRYRAAAATGLALARLQDAQERIGFVPLAPADYLRGLAAAAGASLTAVLGWLGLGEGADLARVAEPQPLARLARAIGLSWTETLALLRLEFSQQASVSPVPLLIARRQADGSAVDPLALCQQVLQEIESEYSPNAQRRLRRLADELRQAYDDTAP